ncbi:MAG: tetratricopeptide repeat protein [Fimbriimonadaceae bacterium]
MSGSRQVADEKFAAGDMAGAAVAYAKALQDEPGAKSLHRPLALCLTSLKRFDEAILQCREAITFQPADLDSRYALGFCLGGKEDFEGAIRELDGVLGLQPNHAQATQILIHCLVEKGKRDLADSPRAAEEAFQRASRLSPSNHQITGLLLNTLATTGQKGKAVEMYKNLSADAKSSPSVAPVIENMQRDPSFQTLMKQVDVRQSGPQAAAPQKTTNTIDTVRCTNCGQMIVSYAAICPYCNFKFRATGTFAGRDTGPDHDWQEVAYMIIAILFTCYAGFNGFQHWTSLPIGIRGFVVTFDIISVCIGVGLIFRLEWIQFLAKIICYFNLLVGSYMLMITFFSGAYMGALFAVLQLAIAGFMVYLINYVGE